MIREKKEIEIQKDNTHELLEKKVYDIETFLTRQHSIKNKLEAVTVKIEKIQEEINREHRQLHAQENFIPKVKNVLEAYHSTDDVEKKNKLLKFVIDKAFYLRKTEWTKLDQFEIKLYTKI